MDDKESRELRIFKFPGCRLLGPATPAATAQEALQPGPCRHGRNYTWAELMKRVWELDVLECPRCRGRMKIVAAINSPNAIQKILNCLGLPSRAPALAAPARTSSDQLEWS